MRHAQRSGRSYDLWFCRTIFEVEAKPLIGGVSSVIELFITVLARRGFPILFL